jgi:hypothetical protein
VYLEKKDGEMKSALLLCCLVLAATACTPVLAQSWNSGQVTGLTSVDVSSSGNQWTFVMHNLSGTQGDTNSPNFDILVWSLELFNFHAPNIGTIVAPTGWTWNDKKDTFEVTNNQKYFTGPALAPGGTFTFSYQSTSSVLSNTDTHAPMNGVLAHVGAVDSTKPGNSTVQWKAFNTPNGQTWHDRSGNNVPEPASIMSLIGGMTGMLGLALRRRK